MAKTTNPRLGTSAWSADTDLWPGRAGINTELATINANAAIWGQGTTAARPVSAYSGRYYWATDTSRLWYDSGTVWTEVSPVGGGGTPASVDIGDAGVEGSSRIAARADHQHAVAVPATDPGAVAYSGSMSRGVSTTTARSDHTHALAALPLAASPPGNSSYNVASTTGTSTNLARQDHTHNVPSMLATNWQVLSGSQPPNGGQIRFSTYTDVFTTNVSSDITVPTGFANGLLYCQAMSVDETNSGPISLYMLLDFTAVDHAAFRCIRNNINSTNGLIPFGMVRVQMLALGW